MIPVQFESSKCRQKKVLKKRAQIALKTRFERRFDRFDFFSTFIALESGPVHTDAALVSKKAADEVEDVVRTK